MTDDFILLTTFSYPHEMSIICSILDSENIKYYNSNENLVSIDPFLSNAVGGIKLYVYKDDFERANETYLKYLEKINQPDKLNDEDKEWEEEKNEESKAKSSMLKNVIIALIVLFIIFALIRLL